MDCANRQVLVQTVGLFIGMQHHSACFSDLPTSQQRISMATTETVFAHELSVRQASIRVMLKSLKYNTAARAPLITSILQPIDLKNYYIDNPCEPFFEGQSSLDIIVKEMASIAKEIFLIYSGTLQKLERVIFELARYKRASVRRNVSEIKAALANIKRTTKYFEILVNFVLHFVMYARSSDQFGSVLASITNSEAYAMVSKLEYCSGLKRKSKYSQLSKLMEMLSHANTREIEAIDILLDSEDEESASYA